MDIIIYCDGAVSANGTENNFGGYAAIVQPQTNPPVAERVVVGTARSTTNQKMELMAAILGFKVVNKISSLPCNVTVISDSQYVVQGMSEWIKNWQKRNWTNAAGKPVANKDLWLELLAESSKHKTKFTWVRGHDGHIENSRCDKLAVEARLKLERETKNE